MRPAGCGIAAGFISKGAVSTMRALLLVGIGGMIGSVARYKAGGWVLHLTTLEKFPYSTFSAFGRDALYLLRRGESLTAVSYAGFSVIFGLAAAWLGLRLVQT